MADGDYDDEDEEGLDEEEREERKEARDALNSAALSRIMRASNKGNRKQTLDDAILSGWKVIGARGGLVGYSGTIHSETTYKNRKKGTGKIYFWDEYIAVYRGEDRVFMHKVKYKDGFRRGDAELFDKIVDKLRP